MKDNIQTSEINQVHPKNSLELRSDTHSFDTDLAAKYGIEVAIMLKHINYWVNYNKRLNNNFYEGRYWFYNTLDEIAAHFPYWSKDQVYRILKKMVDKQLILKGNYNKTSMDRTLWYTINCKMHIVKSQNGYCEIATPIPNTNTNTKKVLSKDNTKKTEPDGSLASDDAHALFEYFNTEYKKMRQERGLSTTDVQKTKAQMQSLKYLLNKYSMEHIKKVIIAALMDKFWYQHVNKPSYLKAKFESLEALLSKTNQTVGVVQKTYQVVKPDSTETKNMKKPIMQSFFALKIIADGVKNNEDYYLKAYDKCNEAEKQEIAKLCKE